MFYVYVLQSKKDQKMYTGYTKDLKTRFELHNKGRNDSTKLRGPFKLVYYEAFIDQKDATNREKWLKSGWGRNHLKKILTNYLKSLGG